MGRPLFTVGWGASPTSVLCLRGGEELGSADDRPGLSSGLISGVTMNI